jgi:hypothetical protein
MEKSIKLSYEEIDNLMDCINSKEILLSKKKQLKHIEVWIDELRTLWVKLYKTKKTYDKSN